MASRLGSMTVAALCTAILGGCAAPMTERLQPGLDGARHVVALGICHTADMVRFTASGIGNVIDRSTRGIVHLAIYADAADGGDDAVILAIAGGVLGAGAGIAKTLDEWRPGVDDCLRDRAHPSDGRQDGYISS